MIIECPTCHSKYRYDEERFEGKASKKIKCARCQGIFQITNPQPRSASDARIQSDATPNLAPTELLKSDFDRIFESAASLSDAAPSASFAVVWDPELLTPDEYADLVTALGDIARAHGADGVRRVLTDVIGIRTGVEVA